MPKILIIETCLVNHGDDAGGIAHEAGETIDVNKDTAIELAKYGRSLFLNKADDPTKTKQYSASTDMVKAVEAAAKARAAAAKAAEQEPA